MTAAIECKTNVCIKANRKQNSELYKRIMCVIKALVSEQKKKKMNHIADESRERHLCMTNDDTRGEKNSRVFIRL